MMWYCETTHSSHPIPTAALLVEDPVVSQSRLLGKKNKQKQLDIDEHKLKCDKRACKDYTFRVRQHLVAMVNQLCFFQLQTCKNDRLLRLNERETVLL